MKLMDEAHERLLKMVEGLYISLNTFSLFSRSERNGPPCWWTWSFH